MKSVHFRKSPKLPLSTAVVSFLLVIVLVACGTNAATPSPSQKGSGSTAQKTTSTSLHLNPGNANVKIGNLVIQSSYGFQCPYASANGGGDLELGHLVFASDRITYSQAEIAQMRAYLTYVENNNGVVKGGTEPPPPTLHWVLGGATTYIPGTSTATSEAPDVGCEATLTLTNTGNTPIQIPKVGGQIKARPQQNTYQYRLIDACSLKILYCPPTGESGGGSCSLYFAGIHLGLGEPNNVFSAVPSSTPGCSTLTIAPAAQIYLEWEFFPDANISQNLIYSIVPVLTVDTTQGEQTFALPQLGSTLAFASANQFSCYGLQGTTFVMVKSPKFAQGNSPFGVGRNWCL